LTINVFIIPVYLSTRGFIAIGKSILAQHSMLQLQSIPISRRESMTNESLPQPDAPGSRIVNLRFEHNREALGIGTPHPRLSWQVTTAATGWRQSAYEIESYAADGQLREVTRRVDSGESVLVEWPFAPLASREQRQVRVRAWGADGLPTAWSALAPVEAGLLTPADWSAKFISPDWEEDNSQPRPAPLLRKEFAARAGITRARLYVTALGVFEVEINGEVVGDQLMAPGWTSYTHRLRYQTFDVTGLLRAGRNALGAMLGDGWFRGRIGFGGGRRSLYGDRLALLAQLEIEYADGTRERIVSDEDWRAASGPILASDIYDGETYDARLECADWSKPGFADDDWVGVRVVEWNLSTLVAPAGPPVRRIELLEPVSITQSPSGQTVIDFGQNLVGRLRLSVQGPAGQTITLRHAEVLENGELCTRPLRFAKATDRYTLKGAGVETWEPRFTFHGFRYAEVAGWPGELKAGNIRAVVCHSDMLRTGWFECSDPLINRLHENVVWSMRGNFLDLPTDCPQRDERLGWTGDIQVFSPTATFLYDCAGFLSSWLADLAAEQAAAGGIVPYVVPNVIPRPTPPTAVWGDAAVIIPWVLYQRFGDLDLLARQFDSMRLWVDTVAKAAGPSLLWDQGFQFGDWLDPSAPPERPGDAKTDPAIIATASFAHSAELVGKAAGLLGRPADQARYGALAEDVRSAFAAQYVTPAGRVLSDATTAYALVLQFGLLPDPAQRQRAGQRLAELARKNGYRISTGFVGTPLICDALCAVGDYETAFRLLTQRQCPSWLYPVTMGATTIWERWDSLRPDGSVNPGEMTSFNHYALGAIADWLHRTVGGLAPVEPGYRKIAIAPHPGGSLTGARARHITPYGLTECAWAIAGGQITVDVVVPPNTSARVSLPGREKEPVEVGAGAYHWSYPYQTPVAARPPRSLDSTLAELFDDPAAWEAVKAVAARHGVDLASLNLGEVTNLTLDQVLALLPGAGEMVKELEEALGKLQ
jgi:alpha-L-rhamnosidase